MHRSSTVYKQNSPKQFIIKYVVDFDVTKGDGLFHWRNQSYGLWTCILGRCDGFEVKSLDVYDAAFSFYKTWLTDGLERCG